jgi:hypothetical protein
MDEIIKVKMKKKWKKNILQFEKNHLLTISFCCSFAFAFQRWFIKFEKIFL